MEAGRAITADPAALSAAWRQKQLEYTWLRPLMGAYVDFWAVTEAALRHTVRRLGLDASDAQMRRLMEAYLSLACFPEVPVRRGRPHARSAPPLRPPNKTKAARRKRAARNGQEKPAPSYFLPASFFRFT
jgi:hypothetical protein